MKKILFCIFLALICVLTLSAGAEAPFLNFEFSHNAGEGLNYGDSVICTVKYSDISDVGLSSAEFVVEYSDGLEFNNDTAATGLDSGWTIWEPNLSDGKIKFAIVDDSAVTPGKSDVTITFSFKVKTESFSSERIQLAEKYIYDFDTNEVKDYTSEVSDSAFFVSLPELELENAGASLRLNNTPALRFGLRAIKLPDGVEYGIVVSESDKLDGELTLSSSSAIILDAKNTVSNNIFCTDAFEIASSTERYTFRPFVKLTMSDGGDYYIYFDALERSASDVAAAELEVVTDEKLREMLNGFYSGT